MSADPADHDESYEGGGFDTHAAENPAVNDDPVEAHEEFDPIAN